jgi:alkylation response protein AidB-like acyl-CoA dehydrogenase
LKGGAFLIEAAAPEDVFTPEDLTDQHRLIAETGEQFMSRDILPRSKDIEEKKPGLLRELLKKAAEVGLCGTDVPQRYGGLELDKISSIIVSEKMARNGSWASTIGAQSGIGILPIALFGTEEQKQKYVPRLAAGEWVGAYALSEASSGSDALHCRARASLSAEGRCYLLNGSKMWVTNGGIADVYVVFAKVDGEKFTAFIVERNFPGVSPGAEEHKMGIRGASTTAVHFENTPVPVENVLGEIGEGHRIAFNILNFGRLKLGAGCVGASKYLIAEAARWANEREAFGQRIGDFGLIKEKLGEMIARTYGAESISYRIAGLIERALEGARSAAPVSADATMAILREYAIECSILKVIGTETLHFVADETVQVYGGYGFSSDYEVEKAFRDQRVNRIFEGTNEINRLLIVDMLVKRALKGELELWSAARKLLDDMLSLPTPPAENNQPLGDAAALVEGLKKTALLVAGLAAQKYMTALSQEQEVASALSNLVMEAYALETTYLRALKKMIHDPEAPPEIEVLRVCAYEAADQAEMQGRRALARIAQGDELRAYWGGLRRFLKREPPDLIGLKRRLADRALEMKHYPFA